MYRSFYTIFRAHRLPYKTPQLGALGFILTGSANIAPLSMGVSTFCDRRRQTNVGVQCWGFQCNICTCIYIYICIYCIYVYISLSTYIYIHIHIGKIMHNIL